jgi:putative ATP-binding cassette transporter
VNLAQMLLAQDRQLAMRALRMSALAAITSTVCFALITMDAQDADDGNRASNTLHVVQFIVALLLYVFAQRFALNGSARVIESASHAWRARLLKKLQSVELRSSETIGTQRILASVFHDTLTIAQAGTSVGVGVQSLVLVVFASAYLAYISVTALVLTLAVATMAAFFYQTHAGSVRKALASAQERSSDLQEHIGDFIAGFRELKLSQPKAARALVNAIDASADTMEYRMKAQSEMANDYVFAQMAFFGLLATIVYVLPIVKPDSAATISKSVAAVMFLIGPLFGLVASVPQFAVANLASNSLHDMDVRLDQVSGSVSSTSASDSRISFESVCMQGVSFTYDANGQSFTTGPIDFQLRPGEVVFITGSNGSGKTTFFKLLTSLYQPQSGLIKLDEKSVWPGQVACHRSLFAAVFSDFYLLQRTLEPAWFTDPWARSWLDRLQLTAKLESMNGRLVTQGLSTGQKKRLALFLALIEKRPILLLDEWAADQDPQFRRYFYDELLPALRDEGKTVVAVTHDEMYFDRADRRLHLSGGLLTEMPREDMNHGN